MTENELSEDQTRALFDACKPVWEKRYGDMMGKVWAGGPILKPCPFCGGSPKLETDPHRKEFGRDRFRIVCSSCYAGTRWYGGPDEAWLMWNGRVKE